MSRRNSRRVVRVKQTISYDEISSESEPEPDLDWLELFKMALKKSKRSLRSAGPASRRRSTPKKRTPTRSRRRLSNLNVPLPCRPTITVSNTVTPISNVNITTSITLDDTTLARQTKTVEDKVESFFKAHNLISDDEDDDMSSKKCPKKDTKEFYEISDSDDDCLQPSTSFSTNIPKFSKDEQENLSNHAVNLSDTSSNNTKDDELMDMVDKILENGDKSMETTEKEQSWTDYKTRAQELLGNISNLLNDISKDAEPATEEKPTLAVASPEPVKPTCPICFEKLGGDILAMTTTCGHIFCKTCIEQIAKTIKKCPTCRSNVTKKKIHPIYL